MIQLHKIFLTEPTAAISDNVGFQLQGRLHIKTHFGFSFVINI
jgi:hypothetical protein